MSTVASAQERVTTPFGFSSTAEEVIAGVDLSGRRAVVTGASSGIGVETARALLGAGAAVTLAVRNTDAGSRVAAELRETTGKASVQVAELDLSNRGSVARFVQDWSGPLHILVNNAGIMATPEWRNAEGWELQFATNHLGHFQLATGLHHALAAARGARVVSVSSAGHLRSPVIFDDLHFRFRPYDPALAYGQSKTANVLFAVGAAERWAADGITANALHPGGILTNLMRYLEGKVLERTLASVPEADFKTPQQGAATSVLLAASPLLDGVTGRYFSDCNEALLTDHRPSEFIEASRVVAPYALDAANAERLWDVSSRMLS